MTIIAFTIPIIDGDSINNCIEANNSLIKITSYVTNEVIQKEWNKAKDVLNENPSEVRMDACGARIWRKEYGNRKSDYGWEIDHIIPVSKGGTDDIKNLQALQWENSEAKGDGLLIRK